MCIGWRVLVRTLGYTMLVKPKHLTVGTITKTEETVLVIEAQARGQTWLTRVGRGVGQLLEMKFTFWTNQVRMKWMESTLSGRAATIGDNGLCVRAGAYVCVLVRACVCARASIMSVLITVQVYPTLGQCAGSTTEFRQCCNIMLRASFSCLCTITILPFVVQSSLLIVCWVDLMKIN